MKPTKKRNPQDATLRNIRALRKRVADLEALQKKDFEYLKDLVTKRR